ncbi:MAG: hypothetical protein HN725_08850 [Alphaproteobacteria bacterium]|jgi:hypothetical protein|nr:hypothetical protein [Alphaproteobacteria bacterium]MBT4082554.1 hypothetical protein [Alphaproteobacteria bacterium]MBT5563013.1 hypothetical protein [Rhodospirillaceae bacterium]MBT7745384.1 hypothetical protein [Alphaproteobacteria bacterium]
MPYRDLRTADGTLDPLAPFIVLALMCFPRTEDKQHREQMLSTIRLQTGVGKPRVRTITEDGFFREVDKHAAHAAISGSLLMTCIQHHKLGENHSLEVAIDLARTLPDRWEPVYGFETVEDDKPAHMPHSRRKMMDAFNQYLSVAHLWAAFLHGQQNERGDIAPYSNDLLPTFLAYGEAFAQMAFKVPFRSPNRRVLLPENQRWHFLLPDKLTQKIDIYAQPTNISPT